MFNKYDTLLTKEDTQKLEKIHFKSRFYPFFLKKRRLNRILREVKKILYKYGVDYPISMDFSYPKIASIYSRAVVEKTSYTSPTIKIHYNPLFISEDIEEHIKTGLHEYSHIFCLQASEIKKGVFQFYGIDGESFSNSINYVLNNEIMPKVRSKLKQIGIDDDDYIREDFFCEWFQEYLLNKHDDISNDVKQQCQNIIKSHIIIMNLIHQRRLYFNH